MGCVITKSNIASPKPLGRHILDSAHKKTTLIHDTTKEITQFDYSLVHRNPLQQSTQAEEFSIQLNPLESTPNSDLPIIIVTQINTPKPVAKTDQPKILETKRQLSEITIEPHIPSQPIQTSAEPIADPVIQSEQVQIEQSQEEDYVYEEEDSIMRDYFSLVKYERPKGHMKSLSQQFASSSTNLSDTQTRSKCKTLADSSFKYHSVGRLAEIQNQEQVSSSSNRNMYTFKDDDIKLPRIKKYFIFRHDLDMFEINKLLEDLKL